MTRRSSGMITPRSPIAVVPLLGAAAIAASYMPRLTFLVLAALYVREYLRLVVAWERREQALVDQHFEAALHHLRITTPTIAARAADWTHALECNRSLREQLENMYEEKRASWTDIIAARQSVLNLRTRSADGNLEALVRVNDELRSIIEKIQLSELNGA